jgi:hypothetical protein
MAQPCPDVLRAAGRLAELSVCTPKTLEVMRLGAQWLDTIKCSAQSSSGQAYLTSMFVRFLSVLATAHAMTVLQRDRPCWKRR